MLAEEARRSRPADQVSSRSKASLIHVTRPFLAWLEDHLDDIEPHGCVLEPLLQEIATGGMHDAPALVPVDRLARKDTSGPPGAHLDHHKGVAIHAEDVDLAPLGDEVALQHPQALGSESVGHLRLDVLAAAHLAYDQPMDGWYLADRIEDAEALAKLVRAYLNA